MQRWIKLPSGSWLDANRVCFVSKVDSFPKLDDEGNAAGTDYAVTIATDLSREQQMLINGTADEIRALLKTLIGG